MPPPWRAGRAWAQPIDRLGASGLFFNGLLDLEASYDARRGDFAVFGRGAAAARASVAGFRLGAEVDLRATDLATLSPGALLQARRVDGFARQRRIKSGLSGGAF